MPYRILWKPSQEILTFRLRLKEWLGPKWLERIGIVGIILSMGGPILLMIIGILMGNSLPPLLPALTLLGLILGMVLTVSSQVIELGSHYWTQDD